MNSGHWHTQDTKSMQQATTHHNRLGRRAQRKAMQDEATRQRQFEEKKQREYRTRGRW